MHTTDPTPLKQKDLWLEFLKTNGNPNQLVRFAGNYGPALPLQKRPGERYANWSTLFRDLDNLNRTWNIVNTVQKHEKDYEAGRKKEALPKLVTEGTPDWIRDPSHRKYLLDKINSLFNTYEISQFIDMNDRGVMGVYFKPKTLAGAIILQYCYYAFNNRKHVRKCKAPGCEELFVCSRRDKLYCDATCRQRHFDHKHKGKLDPWSN